MGRDRLSPGEMGLLTIASRRGCVGAPRVVDQRYDPTGVARLGLLRRLAGLGLLKERTLEETTEPGLAEFVITEAGIKALDA